MLRHIFISYAHSREDEAIALRLTHILETGGRRVWIDKRQLGDQAGGQLNSAIANAISVSHLLVLVQSGYALASQYVQAENIYAVSKDVPVLRIELEPTVLPQSLLPLASRPCVKLHLEPRASWDRCIVEGLSEQGVRLNIPARIDPLITTRSRVVRPGYSVLRNADAVARRAVLTRLTEAIALSPDNGYNALSLAFVRLSLRDLTGALADANRAISLLPDEGEAYYARALISASSQALKEMFHNRAVAALQDLAIARRLADPGVHVDVLSAVILDGHFLANSKTPPAQPKELIAMAQRPDRAFWPDEIHRLLDTIPVSAGLRADIARLMAR